MPDFSQLNDEVKHIKIIIIILKYVKYYYIKNAVSSNSGLCIYDHKSLKRESHTEKKKTIF